MFFFMPEKYWAGQNNQKNFFLEIAAAKGFDPNIAHHWYSVPIEVFENRPVCYPLPPLSPINLPILYLHSLIF
jgi:hypothetical protein